ncbi:DNA-binding transcriptional ArsR family regulator [Cryobacterium mesophilum]|uniref:ArsR family transcriptional regulator n=1 Tax=Terrimesophilobacter mesophilus TaxID=433647 RepID=A0A4R8VAQ0_9MICO|nr:helix-turn-helix domain-containing protein [Terrimesophilobacter mesophilus]MBB5632328.1 DNA-binding transcriptional ArsR family regulator [Terrimesophilobacter mesophilus]TFB79170.1 ArsR family transcriptional regulator [Terrimesophilobacter mesophilus]
MSDSNEPEVVAHDREIDLESLKALAHPLRVKIFDVLSTYGSFTASGLAERLGESSGATSYHLRQLEKHGFVREVAGKGVGRERWWERTPGGINLGATEAKKTSAGREASQLVMREWSSSRERNLAEFLERGYDELDDKWGEASLVSLTNVFITAEQLSEFSQRYMAMVSEFADLHRYQKTPGSRPVQIQFHAFPVIDGEEIPSDDTPEGETTS